MRREWDHELRYWKQKGARRAGHRLLCSHPFLLLDAMLESSSRKPWGCLPGPGGLPEQGSRKVDIRHPELNFNFTPLVLFSTKEGEFPRGKGARTSHCSLCLLLVSVVLEALGEEVRGSFPLCRGTWLLN